MGVDEAGIRPGRNDILESARADVSCKYESLGSVKFKGLHPVDDATQQELDSRRKSERAWDAGIGTTIVAIDRENDSGP